MTTGKEDEEMKELAIYIHLPFCVRKCLYCDFVSGPYSEEVQNNYVNQLLKEIDWFFEKEKKKSEFKNEGENGKNKSNGFAITSVFFGGGTPSILPAEKIEKILCKLKEHAVFRDPEITIEVNPGTVEESAKGRNSFQKYIAMGINRISIGRQSAREEELKKLGRIHDNNQFKQTFLMAREAGFDNISVDLMYALPGQDFSSFEESLRDTAELNPEHISAYSLIVEEGTPFYDMALDLPDEEEERRMYESVADILSEYGFVQYEISNYSKPGRECRHNIAYWTGKEYVGFGIAAASFFQSERFTNTESMEEYLGAGDYGQLTCLRRETQCLSGEDRMSEFVILGLRMNRGVIDSEFYNKFGHHTEEIFRDPIYVHIKNGLLWKNEKGDIGLTENGRNLGNFVMKDFLI